MVTSSIMEESQTRGKIYDGVVGRLDEVIIGKNHETMQTKDTNTFFQWAAEPLSIQVDESNILKACTENKTEQRTATFTDSELRSADIFGPRPLSPYQILISVFLGSKLTFIGNPRMTEKVLRHLIPSIFGTSGSTDQTEPRRSSNDDGDTLPAWLRNLSQENSDHLILVLFINPIKKQQSRLRRSRERRTGTFASPQQSSTAALVYSEMLHMRNSTSIQNLRMALWLSMLTIMIPVIIIAALSGFDNRESTRAQRVWTMTWLAFGSVGSQLSILLSMADVSAKSSGNEAKVMITRIVTSCSIQHQQLGGS